MTDDDDDEEEEVEGESEQHIAIAQALARHLEVLAAEVSDDEVGAFIGGFGLLGRMLNRERVRRLLGELIARRQRRGQFAAFGIDR